MYSVLNSLVRPDRLGNFLRIGGRATDVVALFDRLSTGPLFGFLVPAGLATLGFDHYEAAQRASWDRGRRDHASE